MLNVVCKGERGTWNEKTYSSPKTDMVRIYVGKAELHITKEEVSNLKRFGSNVKPEKPTNNQAMKNSICPKCGGYCYGDCEA